MGDKIGSDTILVSCTKGILNDTLETVHEVLSRVLPENVHPRLAYLSGPSFAAEVGAGLPSVVTIAGECGLRTNKQTGDGWTLHTWGIDGTIVCSN